MLIEQVHDLVDAGLYPFVACPLGRGIEPAEVQRAGPGGLVRVRCNCGRPCRPGDVQFVDEEGARSLGWVVGPDTPAPKH